jgi:hypothetical protein
MKTTSTIFWLVLLFMGIFPSSGAIVNTSRPANGMWIEPATEYFSNSTPVGTRFNVTVWMNVTKDTNAWQLFLVYDRTLLQALRCGYTGDNKSEWSGVKRVVTVSPVLASWNSSYSYVLHGEVLNSSATMTGAGSLSWVEFNITYVPPKGISIYSEIRLDQVRPFSSYALDVHGNRILPFTFGMCDYSVGAGAPISSSGYVIRRYPKLWILLGIMLAFAVVTGASLAIIMTAGADSTRRRRKEE